MKSEQGQGLIVFIIILALVIGAVVIMSGDMTAAGIFLEVFSYHG